MAVILALKSFEPFIMFDLPETPIEPPDKGFSSFQQALLSKNKIFISQIIVTTDKKEGRSKIYLLFKILCCD